MEDTKKSVICYENMLITPALLQYLYFTDITSEFRGLEPQSVFFHLSTGVIAYYHNSHPTLRARLNKKFPDGQLFYKLPIEGLDLRRLVRQMHVQEGEIAHAAYISRR